MGFFSKAKGAIGSAVSAAAKIAPADAGAAWEAYQRDLAQWEVDHNTWIAILAAMDQCEAQKQRAQQPGECKKCGYWCLMWLCLVELPIRCIWHLLMYFIAYILCCLSLGNIVTCYMQLAMHDVYLRWYIHIALRVICENLQRPCDPLLYVYIYDVTLDRPPEPIKPLPPGTPNAVKEILHNAPRKCGCCGDCCNCSCNPCEACEKFIAQFWPRDSNRLYRASFCALSCHHSLHPAGFCGPLCTQGCCETWPQRIERWNREQDEKRVERTRQFYQDSGMVAPPATRGNGNPTLLGKPQQQAMGP